MTHTPIPWQADLIAIEDDDGVRCVQVYGPEGQGHGRVAQVYAECGRPEELWHNVHLVEATPDMLEACEAARKVLVYLTASDDPGIQKHIDLMGVAIAKANAAINKARCDA